MTRLPTKHQADIAEPFTPRAGRAPTGWRRVTAQPGTGRRPPIHGRIRSYAKIAPMQRQIKKQTWIQGIDSRERGDACFDRTTPMRRGLSVAAEGGL
jgi:hypothetical protein